MFLSRTSTVFDCVDFNRKMPGDVKNFTIIARDKLSDFQIIGEGGFGYIHKAKHEDWGTVAVKSLKAEHIADRLVTH